MRRRPDEETEDLGPVRVLGIKDVQAKFPVEIRPSTDWIREHVPNARKRGRLVYWLEHEVDAWLRENGG